MRNVSKSKLARAGLAAVGALALGIGAADARVGGGSSSGSRGAKSFTAPPATNTAPRAAQPVQRSTAQPAQTAGQAGRAAAAASPSRWGSGFGGLLMGGLLGAGLFGLLSGSGLFGGLSGMAGFLGLMLQVALVGGLVWLALAFFRNRNAMSPAGSAAGLGGSMARQGKEPQGYRPMGTPAGSFATAAAPAQNVQPLQVEPADFEAFERLLGRVQTAYGKESVAELRMLATPEMAGFLSEDIAENQRRNVHNLVSDAKLLQGDLSEAWRESDAEYATVAMRFSILDTTVERGTGRIIEGNGDVPVEVTEVWTFARRPGSGAGGWKLSAIQQVQ